MKRSFEIEFPDECGPMWMNKDNLLLCLNSYCKNTEFKVQDITDSKSGFLYRFFQRFLPFYFPGRCKRIFLAIWSAPMEPAKLKDYWKSLRITIRGHGERQAWVRLVLKKGTV